MGRLEKQIIIGALALVGVLLTVVVLKGLKPREGADPQAEAPNGWGPGQSPELIVPVGASSTIPLDAQPGPALTPRPEKDPVGIQPAVLKGGEEKAATGNLIAVPPPPIEEEPAKKDEPWVYTVQQGEYLSGIAERLLGSVRYMSAIQDLNPGLDVDKITAGDELWIPALSSLRDKPAAKEADEPQADGQRRHTVASGDSLSEISNTYYGTSREVGRIVRANPDLLRSEDTVLRIGWVLVIPTKE